MLEPIIDTKKQEKLQYYYDYIEKNKEKLKKNYICDICGGKYKYISKAHHIKTKKHVNMVEIQRLKNIISDINKKINVM